MIDPPLTLFRLSGGLARRFLGLERRAHLLQLRPEIRCLQKSHSGDMGGQEHILQPAHLGERSGCFQKRVAMIPCGFV